MKTVVIGGTYNPVHNGHLYIGEEIKKQLGYERILFVPSNVPPHKAADEETASVHRIKMLEYALEKSSFQIEKCEIERGGTSYTIDTISYLTEKYDITGRPALVIGDDLVAGFKKWHRWEELVSKADLVVVHRNYREKLEFDLPHRYIDNLMIPVSSRDIRERVRKGYAYRYLIPEKVYEYIEENKLYTGK